MGFFRQIFRKPKKEPTKKLPGKAKEVLPVGKKPIESLRKEEKEEKVDKETELKKSVKKEVKPAHKKGYQRKQSTSYKVLVKPVISEKATDLQMYNKYIFEVAPDANKVEIKKAIEEIYGVKPIRVSIVTNIGKKVRFGRVEGVTKNTKKAIVSLKPGETIEVFKGV